MPHNRWQWWDSAWMKLVSDDEPQKYLNYFEILRTNSQDLNAPVIGHNPYKMGPFGHWIEDFFLYFAMHVGWTLITTGPLFFFFCVKGSFFHYKWIFKNINKNYTKEDIDNLEKDRSRDFWYDEYAFYAQVDRNTFQSIWRTFNYKTGTKQDIARYKGLNKKWGPKMQQYHPDEDSISTHLLRRVKADREEESYTVWNENFLKNPVKSLESVKEHWSQAAFETLARKQAKPYYGDTENKIVADWIYENNKRYYGLRDNRLYRRKINWEKLVWPKEEYHKYEEYKNIDRHWIDSSLRYNTFHRGHFGGYSKYRPFLDENELIFKNDKDWQIYTGGVTWDNFRISKNSYTPSERLEHKYRCWRRMATDRKYYNKNKDNLDELDIMNILLEVRAINAKRPRGKKINHPLLQESETYSKRRRFYFRDMEFFDVEPEPRYLKKNEFIFNNGVSDETFLLSRHGRSPSYARKHYSEQILGPHKSRVWRWLAWQDQKEHVDRQRAYRANDWFFDWAIDRGVKIKRMEIFRNPLRRMDIDVEFTRPAIKNKYKVKEYPFTYPDEYKLYRTYESYTPLEKKPNYVEEKKDVVISEAEKMYDSAYVNELFTKGDTKYKMGIKNEKFEFNKWRKGPDDKISTHLLNLRKEEEDRLKYAAWQINFVDRSYGAKVKFKEMSKKQFLASIKEEDMAILRTDKTKNRIIAEYIYDKYCLYDRCRYKEIYERVARAWDLKEYERSQFFLNHNRYKHHWLDNIFSRWNSKPRFLKKDFLSRKIPEHEIEHAQGVYFTKHLPKKEFENLDDIKQEFLKKKSFENDFIFSKKNKESDILDEINKLKFVNDTKLKKINDIIMYNNCLENNLVFNTVKNVKDVIKDFFGRKKPKILSDEYFSSFLFNDNLDSSKLLSDYDKQNLKDLAYNINLDDKNFILKSQFKEVNFSNDKFINENITLKVNSVKDEDFIDELVNTIRFGERFKPKKKNPLIENKVTVENITDVIEDPRLQLNAFVYKTDSEGNLNVQADPYVVNMVLGKDAFEKNDFEHSFLFDYSKYIKLNFHTLFYSLFINQHNPSETLRREIEDELYPTNYEKYFAGKAATVMNDRKFSYSGLNFKLYDENKEDVVVQRNSEVYSPLDSFVVQSDKVSGLFTNVLIDIVISFACVIVILSLIFCLDILVKHVFFNFYLKKTYSVFFNLFKSLISSIRSERFFIFILSVFILILFMNVAGFFLSELSLTAHAVITLFLSFIIFFNFVITSLATNAFKIYKLFIQNNLNIFITVFLFFIEVISYFVRPFSLGVRLFANILSGHILIHIFFSAFLYAYKLFLWLSVFLFLVVLFIMTMEVFVSFVQSYIFLILSIIYLQDIFIKH